MKLHLPKLLRNAVLSCITALTAATTTVGSASFTGGVLALSLVSQAQAADITISAGEDNILEASEQTLSADQLPVTGDVTINGAGDQADVRTLIVGEGVSLTVDGTLQLVSRAELSIQKGKVTATTIALGRPDSDSEPYGGAIRMDGGTLTTGTISFNHNYGNIVDLQNAKVEFTTATALTRGSNTSSTVTVSDCTLIANITDWTLDGAGLTTIPTIGDVEIAATNTCAITLSNVALTGKIVNNKNLELSGTTQINGGATIANNAALTLSGTINILSVDGLSTTAGMLSDGTDGYMLDTYLCTNNGSDAKVTIAEGFKLQLYGKDIEYTQTENGDILFTANENGGDYYVNTEVVYDNDSMAAASKFILADGSTFHVSDKSKLSIIEGGAANVYYTNAKGDVILGFQGDVADISSGLNLTIAGSAGADGYLEVVANGNANFTGNIIVGSGTKFKLGTSGETTSAGDYYSEEKNRKLIVENGGLLDTAGNVCYYHVVLNEGATITNTGEDIGDGYKALPWLELHGDATLNAASQMVMQKGGGDTGTFELDLNGHILTKTGDSALVLKIPTITAGTIAIQQGALNIASGTIEEGVCFELQSGSTLNIAGGTIEEGVCFELQSGSTLNMNDGNGYSTADFTMQEGSNLNVVATNKSMNSLLVTESDSTAPAVLQTISRIIVNSSASIYGDFKKTGASDLLLGASNSADCNILLAKGATVEAGILELNGDTTLGGMLVVKSGATLRVGTKAKITLSSLVGFASTGSSAAIPTENGLREFTTLKIVDNQGTQNRQFDVMYKGESCTVDGEGCISLNQAAVYYAMNGAVSVGVDPDTEKATEYYVGEKGTLKIAGDIADGMTASEAFFATSGSGKLIASGVSIEQESTSLSFIGDLELQKDCTVTLKNDNAFANVKSVTLSESSVTIQNGSVQKFSDTQVIDNASVTLGVEGTVQRQAAVTKAVFTGTTTINEGKTLTIANKEASELNIEALAGSGTLVIETHTDMNAHIGVSKNFTSDGKIRISAESATQHTLDIAAEANLSAAQLDTTNGNFTPTIELAGAGTYTLDEGGTVFTKNEQLAEGWAGTVKVSKANITSTVDMSGLANADSKLDINGLTVADGAGLTLGGNVTLDGTIALAETVTNNATLSFGKNLVFDLTGMEYTTSEKGFTYQLFSKGDLSALSISNLAADFLSSLGMSGNAIAMFGSDGYLTISTNEITWEPEQDDTPGVWENDKPFNETQNYDNDKAYTVKFGELEADDAIEQVQIAGQVSAARVEVNPGEGKVYKFSIGEEADGGIEAVEYGIHIQSGTVIFGTGTLDMKQNTTISVESGVLALEAGAMEWQKNVDIQLQDGSTLQWLEGNTEDYTSNGGLTIAQPATTKGTTAGAADSKITLDVGANEVKFGNTIGGTDEKTTIHLKGAAGQDITVASGAFGKAGVKVSGCNVVLQPDAVSQIDLGRLEVDSTAGLELNVANADGVYNAKLNAANGVRVEGKLNLTANLSTREEGGVIFTGGALEVANGAEINLAIKNISGGMACQLMEEGSCEVVLAESAGNNTRARAATEVTITEGDKRLEKYIRKARVFYENGNLILSGGIVTAATADFHKRTAKTANGMAGADLLDKAYTQHMGSIVNNATGDVKKTLDYIENLIVDGNTDGIDDTMAAVAGASTAVLGMASMGDLDRQLRAIRNRTTTMGVDPGVVNPGMPYYNAWINAEADHRELGNSGTESGYKLNSWGGTVGFDADISPTFTAGMALTAMYGDLNATGADNATGEMNSYYLSAFARYYVSAWTHTFVATVGMSDLTLNRTVSLGAGSYETKGDTSAMNFGLMYEVGRVFALNEDATACLQPILNISFRHTTVDAYTEKNSDAGLNVGEQTMDSFTVALGARMQAVVGESVYNRTSIFECRAMVKVDTGDCQGSSEVELLGSKADMKSTEMGSVGFEAGAGLTIPMGDEGGSIFADASIELRSDYSNVNGTIGYRVNF